MPLLIPRSFLCAFVCTPWLHLGWESTLTSRLEPAQAFLVGSANPTSAELHENIELMALADTSEHAYLRSTLHDSRTSHGPPGSA